MRGVHHPCRARIHQSQIGVEAGGDGALAGEAQDAGRGRGEPATSAGVSRPVDSSRGMVMPAPSMPAHVARRSGGQGEWSDATLSMSPRLSRDHSCSRSPASRSGGKHRASGRADASRLR